MDIFERVAKGLAGRGAGVARHPEMEPVLAAAGISDDGSPGIRVDARVAFDRSGAPFARHEYDQYLTSWGHIYNSLRSGFPSERYHGGHEFTGIERRHGLLFARFSDGSRAEADLIIGADGFRSGVRAKVAPEVRPSYSGYVAWRGLMEERELPSDFVSEVFSIHSFCFPPGGEFIGYAVAGPGDSVAEGERSYSFLWYRPAPAGAPLDDLLTDEKGKLHSQVIPPPRIRRDHIERLQHDAVRHLPEKFANVVLRADRHLLQPIYDVRSTHMGFGDVALIGDAAFVARPHVGIGILKAALDAHELADQLDRHATISEALGAFERERLPHGHATVDFGRRLGSFLERGLPAPESDPELGLTVQFILENSARPIRPSAPGAILGRPR